ncbi:hypothetical protein TNCV_598641 [Trichonephila clavipes]|nr:hypothetical protein TNCV_598641 [Trichonephila clavipes]
MDLIPMYDGGESLGIRRYLEKINDVANLGKWSNADKVTILKLKLAGIAEEFFFIRPNPQFVLSRDPNNLEESINAALIEEQNVKLNQIANDERTGLSPLQTETSVISALTNKLEEINLRVERLQEASSVTARKTGGGLFRRRETVFKCYYCGLEGHRQAECRKKRMDERKDNYQPPGSPRANFLFSVTQALILSTGDVSISKNRLFAIITQPPGFRRTVRKQLPGGEVSDAMRETII